MSEVGESITRGAKEALVFAKSEADPIKYRVHIPYEIDVKRIREKLGMSQKDFVET